MADLKISQLTAASTPLAGTEVVPLVQSGATKKVSVADLTAGRAVSMLSSTIGGGGTDGVSYWKRADGVTVQTLAVNSGTGAIDYTTAYTFHRFYNYTGLVLDIGNTDSGKGAVMSAGNLAFGTAAKGVNFTANTPAAGMTSQLLNWYEEGTCNLAFSDGTASSSTVSCRYTRMGRQITVLIQLYNTNVSGLSTSATLTITGLPFTAGATTNCEIFCPNATYSNLIGEVTGTTITLFKVGNNVDASFLKLSDLSSPSNLTVNGAFTYFA